MEQTTEIMLVENIQNKVYVIRGQQVMLDYDLAEIYGYEVKNLNQQVKCNIARFPEDFMFQLTRDEIESVKSQFVISRDDYFLKVKEEAEEHCRMLLQNKVSICLLQFLEAS